MEKVWRSTLEQRADLTYPGLWVLVEMPWAEPGRGSDPQDVLSGVPQAELFFGHALPWPIGSVSEGTQRQVRPGLASVQASALAPKHRRASLFWEGK